jgi:hypothetical protein
VHRRAQVRVRTEFPVFGALRSGLRRVIETMTERNPILVFLLPAITLGIYGLIWLVKTKDEMNQQGAAIRPRGCSSSPSRSSGSCGSTPRASAP